MKKIVIGVAIGLVLGSAFAWAASALQPAAVNGCVYLSSLPTLTTKQSSVFHCDSSGRLLTN